MASLTLIVKPVGNSCPLRCDYCYNNDPNLKQRCDSRAMSFDILERLLFEFFQVPQRKYVIIWHGGEPLLAGIPFYEDVLSLQEEMVERFKIKGKVTNCIQTSGVLIDENWVNFIKVSGIKPGFSVDGPSIVHDAHRFYPDGHGSLSDTIRSIELLRSRGVRIGAGAVINKDSLKHPLEVFEFLRNHFTGFDFSPCFETVAEGGSSSYGISAEEYASFVKTVFLHWWRIDDPAIRVKSFVRYVEAALGKTPEVCSMSSGCNRFLSVDGNGDVYPCGRFAGLPELYLGNITQISFEDIRASKAYIDYLGNAQYIPKECYDCRWKFACNNGCAALRYTEQGTFLPKSPLCEATQDILNFVQHLVKETKGKELKN